MKKLTLIAIAVAGLSSASCTKDRTCTCVSTTTGGGSSTTTTVLKGVNSSAASANCVNSEDKDSNGNTFRTNTCTLS